MRNLVFLTLLILVANSCKKDEEETCCDPRNPECANYDPCIDSRLPTADFFVSNYMHHMDLEGYPLFKADTVFVRDDIAFIGKEDSSDVTHKWYLGAEVITERTFSRDFKDVVRPRYIEVSHVIEHTPNTDCFPDDDGKDSVYKKIFLPYEYAGLNVIGTYRGAYRGTTDTFEVKIDAIDSDGNPANVDNFYDFYMLNFENEGDSSSGRWLGVPGFRAGNNHLVIGYFSHSTPWAGIGKVLPGNRFKWQYRRSLQPDSIYFEGRIIRN